MQDALESAATFTIFAAFAGSVLAAGTFLLNAVITPALTQLASYGSAYHVASQVFG